MPAAPDPSRPVLTASEAENEADSGVGRSYVGLLGIMVLLFAVLAAMAITVYSLVALWPPPTTTSSPHLTYFSLKLAPTRDQQLFIVASLAGALGGLIHSARSLYWYVGNRVLRRSWLAMYLSLPFIGSALAVVFCLILRGGLLTGEATGGQVNFFGFAATSALVGLFSPEAAEKLKQVFSTVLAPAESGRDRPPADSYPAIYGVEPTTGRIGATIAIHGNNLTQTTAVLFHGARTGPASVSHSTVTVEVPQGVSTGSLCLAVGERIVASPTLFHIEA